MRSRYIFPLVVLMCLSTACKGTSATEPVKVMPAVEVSLSQTVTLFSISANAPGALAPLTTLNVRNTSSEMVTIKKATVGIASMTPEAQWGMGNLNPTLYNANTITLNQNVQYNGMSAFFSGDGVQIQPGTTLILTMKGRKPFGVVPNDFIKFNVIPGVAGSFEFVSASGLPVTQNFVNTTSAELRYTP